MTQKEAIESIRMTQYPFMVFEMLPPSLRTPEVSSTAVKRDTACLSLVPLESLTSSVLQVVNWEIPENIRHLPSEHLTEEVCLAILKINPFLLLYIPEEKQTRKMLETVLSKEYNLKESRVLQFFPYLRDPDLLSKAIQKIGASYHHSFLDTLEVIPAHLLTAEMVEHILSRQPAAIEKIPEQFTTHPSYIQVLQTDGMLLKKVPEPLRTQELCEAAFHQNPCAIQFIPTKYATSLPLIEAIQTNPLTLLFTPALLKTKELQMQIAQTGDLAFARHITDIQAAIELFKNYDGRLLKPGIIDRFKEEVVNLRFANAFIERFPLGYEELINRYPAFKENRELAEKAVEINPKNLFFIADTFKTELLCLEAGDKNFQVIEAFPKEIFTPETCRVIVSLDKEGHSPGWIPKECMNYELCSLIAEKALTQYNKKAICFEHIPFPDIILDAIQKAGPVVAEQIYSYADPAVRTEKMKKEVMKIAKEHLKISYLYFVQFPPAVKTPEICLFAVKNTRQSQLLKQFVPEAIKNGENVYSFSQRLPPATYQAFEVDDILNAYQQNTAPNVKPEVHVRQNKMKLS